ncbi:hypothetical protein BABINDRAFT_170995 [Babjeviella inositovora NRRL Y-12698]|uniref:Amino acid permease/ SLC12A domain-containing protein n=1 Tax=Babjeviella inositovora NRRL Y-12698 TaxID=984486 RepID=A0A1E3QSE5_9ASCO|nr:uncharacterized protein BABINDRAFT_170995 [Babjeviella inositovora NRRL Y-12698]ODQ80625.1 hypothetical protein BABINDRAFT_170995 [Babjeviella inositovora NRRL Y-12698]
MQKKKILYACAGERIGMRQELTGWAKFKDGFKRQESDEIIGEGLTDAQKAAIRTAKSPLQRTLKTRHLLMIAMGGGIGTGLFVGSGKVLRTGGPAGILIGYIIMGAVLICTIFSLAELAVAFPVAGSFTTYATRFIDPAWGFAIGWNCCIQWLIILPLELVTASMVIQYWNTSINPDAWIAIFYCVILFINFFGARGYAEGEFFFSSIKVLTIVGFCIFGVIYNCGGIKNTEYIGGLYWSEPGAFNSSGGFKGICSVFVTASFSFGGSEIIGLTASESLTPRKSFPKAIKQIFWRIMIFYISALTVVGLCVPYTSDELLGSTGSATQASPFVIAVQLAGIKGLPSVVNSVILLSVMSVGNTSVYGCSRFMSAMAEQGNAPKLFGYIDKSGRPLVAIALNFLFGLLAFVAASNKQEDIFNWLLSLSGLCTIFAWVTICWSHIRFRSGLSAHGQSTKYLSFVSATGVLGSYFTIVVSILVLMAQFWVGLYPVGEHTPNATVFFQSYLGFFVFFGFYFGYKIWKKDVILFIRAADMDIFTGRKEIDYDLLQQELAEERTEFKAMPFHKKVFKFWCN